MEGNGDIKLDPDVLGADTTEGELRSLTPLSDLYALPVFGEDTDELTRQRRVAENQMLERIWRGVLEAEGYGEEQRLLESIHSRIFQDVSGYSASCGFPSEGFLTEMDGKTEGIHGIGIFLGMMAIGMFFSRKRKAGNDNYFYDRRGNAG